MKCNVLLVLTLTAGTLVGASPSEARIVNCGPHRHAVLRPVRLSNGARADRVVCVGPSRVVNRPYHRSWKKSALVIGGSTAAGAGVGALIGGKKGAVVGGIAGGAAGTAYEVHKRRKHRRRL